ncbi:SMR family transporter [Rhodococcus sp. ARC_M6]|uniref:SMR family transporter n=1 Tax=Rhodococcus sp. ARC_M6 TaxID=2928852 RepID=UPI001FB1AFBB|nr:SMR family transporter [Rhodococcus sp. ARC_M6]MCJ0902090.1 SMR family transporter [Rhodococcus sp. ARC_M6]
MRPDGPANEFRRNARSYHALAIGYLAAFVLLSLALSGGMGLGVAYEIWTACSVALTAVASRVLSPSL